MGILRNVPAEAIVDTVSVASSAGLRTVEIALNTPDAFKQIKQVAKNFSKNMFIGAGTVLDKESAKKAIDLGASFIVMPVVVKEVIKYCNKNNIPVFPGALTPQEIYTAWQTGATMVKVFPSGIFGPRYLRTIKGPFNNIELMAVGGINAQNVREYFNSGASAVAFGESIFNLQLIKERKFKKIKQNIKELITSVKKAIGEKCDF